MTLSISPARRRRPTLVPGFLVLALLATMGAAPQEVNLRPARGPDGKAIDFKVPAHGVTVVVFYSTECPISNAYSPILNRLVGEFREGAVKLIGACVDPDLPDADVRAHAKDFELKFPIVSDRDGSLARRLGARVTPEAFVIDDRNRVRYHGRIDDQFAQRQKRNEHAMTRELHDAIAAVLSGGEVAEEYVRSVGCPLPEPDQSTLKPTYTRDVAVILQRNCQECHRRGQVGPFALETYEQARKRAADLASIAEDRKMPPWKPAPGFGPKFKHDRSLSNAEIAVLNAWSDAGAPEGDPADMPPAPRFPDDWALGTPDLVLEMPESFSIPAGGDDIYRCFVIPTDLPRDQNIAAIEFRPGNRRVVHHILSYVDTTGAGRKRDEADKEPGYPCFSGPGVEVNGDFGGWAPGNEASRLPEGIGRLLPRKADIIVQVHYHPSGKPETDRSKIGVYFSKKPVKQALHWSMAINTEFTLPANASNYEVSGTWKVPADVEALGITPHMHLLGRDITMSVDYPDGRSETLIKIPDWDFGWQNSYWFESPLDLPKGTIVKVVAHYDNSAGNPKNPNRPIKPVRFGEATTDEMCIGFIAVTLKGQDLTQPGARDELHDILKHEQDEIRRKHEQKDKARAAK